MQQIARAAQHGHGIDALQGVLSELKKKFGADETFLFRAIDDLRQCADRHLSEHHEPETLNSIFQANFPEFNSNFDNETIKIDFEKEIGRLAKLHRIVYAGARKAAAKRLGVTVGALDELVKEHRKQHEEESTPSAWPHWNVEPWAETVDCGLLFRALTERIRKHVVLTAYQAVVVALWVMSTWVHDKAAVHSPILLVTSPEPNCGKSTLLGVIGYLVTRSLVSVSIKGPALFRSIEKWHPTFVIDEADTALVNNDDLKEVVNSGWTRGQSVVRCDPKTYDPRPFSTFAPKAIGMKGRNLPDTTFSRAIIVELRRKLPADQVRDFAHVDDANLAELRRKLLRWADDNGTKLAGAEVTIPDSFHNRVRANWKLLLAIAELAEAADKARLAASRFCASADRLRFFDRLFRHRGNSPGAARKRPRPS